jgi:hypothetical protein
MRQAQDQSDLATLPDALKPSGRRRAVHVLGGALLGLVVLSSGAIVRITAFTSSGISEAQADDGSGTPGVTVKPLGASEVTSRDLRIPAALGYRVLGGRQVDALVTELSDTWKLPTKVATEIVQGARTAARAYGLDPLLVLGVAAKESGFRFIGNPGQFHVVHPGNGSGNGTGNKVQGEKPGDRAEDEDRVGRGGAMEALRRLSRQVDPLKPHGLMQVSGEHHKDKFLRTDGGGLRPAFLDDSLLIGTRVLAEYLLLENGNLNRALQRYNGALGDARQRYARQVLEHRERLRRTIENI